MLKHILNGLSAVGNVLDLPGSSVRDALAWKNPFDQWATPLSDANRTSGRDLLRTHGLAGSQNTWGNFAGGLAAEIATDPTNLISGKAILNAMRGRRAAVSANTGIRAANAKSLSQRASGFMPEEIAKQTAIKTAEGAPQRMYHGTNAAFDTFDMGKNKADNLYGRGVYHTDDPAIASTYAMNNPGAQNNRMAYLDIKKPFDMRNLHTVESLDNMFPGSLNGYLGRRFPQGGAPTSIDPESVAMFLTRGNVNRLPETLKKHGYDGIIHKGGKITGGKPHNVTIAFDPSQVYKPYIAKAIQPEVAMPSARNGLKGGIAAYNVFARNRGGKK